MFMNWLNGREGKRYEAAVTNLAILFFFLVGGLTFWLLSQLDLTFMVRAEVSFGIAVYGASRVELWGVRTLVSAAARRRGLVLPTFCLALAAGSQTVIVKYGFRDDLAFDLAFGAMMAILSVGTVVGGGVVLSEIALIYAGIRRIGSNDLIGLLLGGMILMVLVGGILLGSVLNLVGLESHPIGRLLGGIFIVACVLVPVWRLVVLMRREDQSRDSRHGD